VELSLTKSAIQNYEQVTREILLPSLSWPPSFTKGSEQVIILYTRSNYRVLPALTDLNSLQSQDEHRFYQEFRLMVPSNSKSTE